MLTLNRSYNGFNEDEAMDTTQGVAVGGGDEPIAASGPFQEHLPFSFAYKVVSSVVPDFSRPFVSHRGEDTGEMFVRKLQEETEQLFQEYIDTPQQLQELTDAALHCTATNCHICNQSLGGDKVRDHCHIVGNYRGAVHSRCNLECRISCRSNSPLLWADSSTSTLSNSFLKATTCSSAPTLWR